MIQQKMIGDVLLSSILCEYLKKKYPDSEVHYCVYSYTRPVVENNPFIDKIVEFLPEYQKSKWKFRKFLRRIKAEQYTLVVDAYGKIESNLISLYSKAEQRISYDKNYSRRIYTETVQRSSKVYTIAGNALEDRLRLVVKEEEIAQHIIAPKIYLSDEEIAKGKQFLQSHRISTDRPLIMISVLGSADDKSLPSQYMARLIDAIAEETSANFLLNYIPEQTKAAKSIFNYCKPETQARIHFDVYGKGLRDFIILLAQCDALIGNEGGAVNMAKALDIPTFTIYAPWISKKAWNMFEDGIKHLSVHLEDFEPTLYADTKPKELKEQSLELYKKLTPEKILPKLNEFLENQKFKIDLNQS